MSKIVTLRLKDEVYEIFKKLAKNDNRTISNFIETAMLRHIEESGQMDEFETTEILTNKPLLKSLERGLKDAREKKGHFVE